MIITTALYQTTNKKIHYDEKLYPDYETNNPIKDAIEWINNFKKVWKMIRYKNSLYINIMKEIYFIRHGQTDENSLGIRQGAEIDSELNELGREQIKKIVLS